MSDLDLCKTRLEGIVEHTSSAEKLLIKVQLQRKKGPIDTSVRNHPREIQDFPTQRELTSDAHAVT